MTPRLLNVVHRLRCILRVHRWNPKRDYQGRWYRECRDCGAVSGMSIFPPGA